MPKVMIVDDDRTMVKLLKTLFELDGFEVLVVRQGGDFISATLEGLPDIILMDYHLPDATATELLQQIRSTDAIANIPVIVASGMESVEDEVMTAGANAFAVKPMDLDALPNLFMELIH